MRLIPTEASRRTPEASGDIVLVGVAGFHERHHRIRLRHAVTRVVMGEDDAMDRDDPCGSLGSIRDAVVDKDGARRRGRKSQMLALPRRHGAPSCLTWPVLEKRTGFCPHRERISGAGSVPIDDIPNDPSSARNTAALSQFLLRMSTKKRTGFCPHTSTIWTNETAIPGGASRPGRTPSHRAAVPTARALQPGRLACRAEKSGQVFVRTPLAATAVIARISRGMSGALNLPSTAKSVMAVNERG